MSLYDGSYLPDSDWKAFPAGHAVLHFVILRPLSGQRLRLLNLHHHQTNNTIVKEQQLCKICQHFCHFSGWRVLCFSFSLNLLHDWPGVTGSLCRAPAWLLWCLPVSSSAPQLWPAVSRFHLHPLHTWTQPEDTKECMFKFNLAKVIWTEVPRNWNTNTPHSQQHDLNPTLSRTSTY